MTKIGIFTTNSVDKIHPRIEMQVKILESNGYSVDVIRSETKREGFLYELFNLLFLKYFKWRSIYRFKKQITAYDIIHIYDFKLLPLAKAAKKQNKKVIYETLDDNVHLNFHAVAKKIPFLNVFKGILIRKYSSYEYRIAKQYCDKVIVNSPNLLDNFEKSELIYYASSLEKLKVDLYDASKQPCFIYLGKLTIAKGTREYLKLIKEFNIPFIVLGKAFDEESKELLNHSKVDYLGSFNSEDLLEKLTPLLKKFNLIGLSVIVPENKSYELQEANKDIDYMSMGMPFIGNRRKPTFEKINGGAGVLFNDNDSIQNLISNFNESYNKCSSTSRELYENYSRKKFQKRLLSIFHELVNS